FRDLLHPARVSDFPDLLCDDHPGAACASALSRPDRVELSRQYVFRLYAEFCDVVHRHRGAPMADADLDALRRGAVLSAAPGASVCDPGPGAASGPVVADRERQPASPRPGAGK